MRKNCKILLIIPAYNEEKNVLNVYNQIRSYNKKNKTNYDVIVINDGSIDQTSKICHENKIPVIDLVQNLGIGGAVQTGYKYAYNNQYDVAIQFDGDGQHDIAYVENIVEPLISKKANMVIGSRFIDENSSEFKSSFIRRVGINLISIVIKIKTKKKIHDTTSGFRACDKSLIKKFSEIYPTEYPEPISTVSALLDNYEIVELPVSMKERTAGKSSISSWKNVYYMINVFLSILLMKKR